MLNLSISVLEITWLVVIYKSGWFSLFVSLLFSIFHCSSSVFIISDLFLYFFIIRFDRIVIFFGSSLFHDFFNLIFLICSSLFGCWFWSITDVLVSSPEAFMFSSSPVSVSFVRSSSFFLSMYSGFQSSSLHIKWLCFSFWLPSKLSLFFESLLSSSSHIVLMFLHQFLLLSFFLFLFKLLFGREHSLETSLLTQVLFVSISFLEFIFLHTLHELVVHLFNYTFVILHSLLVVSIFACVSLIGLLLLFIFH